MNSLAVRKNSLDEVLPRAKTLTTFNDLLNFLFALNLHPDTDYIRSTPKLIITTVTPIIPLPFLVSQCRFNGCAVRTRELI
jgi:hypothetical protein